MTDHTTEEKINRAVLVGLNAACLSREENATESSMEELSALLETAGGACVGTVLQNKDAPDPRTFIGEGKAAEVKALAEAAGADMVIFDNALSPSQQRVLSEELGVAVMDRSALILDIFAQRARTKEGRLQVELAQYKYLLPRLTGMWGHLVRQTASGGKSPIGTRGPGETQLETDRRHIRKKIAKLEEDLEQVRRVRGVQRERRIKNEVPVVAIVGYTNAGKSTLLNALTGSDIPANNRLFDTLDTTTRNLEISDTCTVLVSDTVGFISKLPHHLVEAFKATLEELSFADLLLHVIDASNPEWREQAAVVDALIRELGAEQTPRIEVFNKSDLYRGDIMPHGEDIVSVSARTGEGLDRLISMIGDRLDGGAHRVTLRLPYDQGGVVDMLYREAKVERVEYGETIEVTAVCTPKILGRVSAFLWNG
ncbi:GTPase HflX [Intestinimonas butyriciproducens]|uniref:GTPase HflX n=1 Tax=Intestinimonas butyriciproducens TaxID=1297617 RepID=UPI0008229694|nr:GTPase HflX [Intestinimonas butyriciproducens]SCI60790.1 GTP-binding protein HflX [uncultured Clostridium sp.]MCI6363219.1 GTPase HflX [Intestinimonas butyriciproducens]MDB7829391.1 GTPase HflX [Intestinimonas butyriciproducens]MDB7860581.1 GTPase HflX [Intestinimonas butyriciproducens]MDB7862743.1 GTPase HflX [Intestinimonas butyriciproducens]